MDSYVAAKLREALAACGNNATVAQRIVIEWAQADDRLLRGLAGPFLKSIVAHAVLRAGGKPGPAPREKPRAKPVSALPATVVNDLLNQMGRNFGQEAPKTVGGGLVVNPKDAKAGPGQEKALRTLAAAFAKKRLGLD
ncbi:MAG TPA: hypothetical protein VEH84_07360 [Alphaproteobacteria bacterium]|nr:hypothetical protein [Alphaproteobacteria bacterium]